MIYIYTGGVGSGKSYSALCAGLDYCEVLLKSRRRYVIANFPIKKANEHWVYWDNSEITPRRLVQFSIEKGLFGHEDSALLIIDEASVMFNNRTWNSNDRLDWIKFFAHSRKLGFEVILIAQNIDSIDKQIRNLADMEIKHLNMRAIPIMGLLVRILYFPVFFRVFYPLRTKFNGFVTIKLLLPWVANRYDTMRLFIKPEELLGDLDEDKKQVKEVKKKENVSRETKVNEVKEVNEVKKVSLI